MKTAESCRKHNISAGMFYQWKAKFGGLDVNDGMKLRPAVASWCEEHHVLGRSSTGKPSQNGHMLRERISTRNSCCQTQSPFFGVIPSPIFGATIPKGTPSPRYTGRAYASNSARSHT
jgi:hypothetical protein